jgi:hypothetical protein
MHAVHGAAGSYWCPVTHPSNQPLPRVSCSISCTTASLCSIIDQSRTFLLDHRCCWLILSRAPYQTWRFERFIWLTSNSSPVLHLETVGSITWCATALRRYQMLSKPIHIYYCHLNECELTFLTELSLFIQVQQKRMVVKMCCTRCSQLLFFNCRHTALSFNVHCSIVVCSLIGNWFGF